jgi:hypothetical protein
MDVANAGRGGDADEEEEWSVYELVDGDDCRGGVDWIERVRRSTVVAVLSISLCLLIERMTDYMLHLNPTRSNAMSQLESICICPSLVCLGMH